jgi:hypothetical protein
MNLVVKPGAGAQLAALPRIAQEAVDDALQRLRAFPRLGSRLEDALGHAYYDEVVIVRRRRWTLHIVYSIEEANLVVWYIDPSWVRRTHL